MAAETVRSWMAGTIALEQLETYFDEALTANDEEMLVTAIAEADRVARLMRVSDHIGHKSKQVPPATCRCGGNQVLWQVLLLWRQPGAMAGAAAVEAKALL